MAATASKLKRPFQFRLKSRRQRWLVLGLIVLFAVAMTYLVLSSRAVSPDFISVGGEGNSCVSAENTVVRDSGSTKREIDACLIKTGGRYWAGNYRLLPNGTYDRLFSHNVARYVLFVRGRAAAETCFYLKAEGSSALVSLRAFGNNGTARYTTTISGGDYRPYCFENNLDWNQVDKISNASVHEVIEGSVYLSSIVVSGLNKPVTISTIDVCRDGKQLTIPRSQRLSSDTDPPCTTIVSDALIVDRNHPRANNSNPGTEDLPWQTITHAATQARAGDTVYVKPGIYAEGKIALTRSGTSAQPIVFSAYPSSEREAIVRGGYFETQGASYVEIRGFKIENSLYGIRVEGPANNQATPATGVVLDNNWTFNTTSSGISVWGVDGGQEPGDYDNIRNITITNNKVEDCVMTGFNECITVANGVRNVEVAYNEITNPNSVSPPGGEGIDFKEGVIGGKIHHNRLYNMKKNAIYMDGGGFWTESKGLSRTFVRDIEIYANLISNVTGGGIIVVNEGPADTSNIRIYNNVVQNTTRHGISVYDHPGGRGVSTIDRVWIVNNTVSSAGKEGFWGGIAIDHPTARNILIRNNIAWANTAFDVRINNPNTLQDNNLCAANFCAIRSNPLFANQSDYKISSGSPAKDRGSATEAPQTDFADTKRPRGNGIDLGAWEL